MASWERTDEKSVLRAGPLVFVVDLDDRPDLGCRFAHARIQIGDHKPTDQFFRHIDAGERSDCEAACEKYAHEIVAALQVALAGGEKGAAT